MTSPNPIGASPVRRRFAAAAVAAVALTASAIPALAHELEDLSPDFPLPTGLYGTSVAVQGDFAAVGASAYGGSVYILERDGDGWEIDRKLHPEQDSTDAHFGTDLAFFEEWLAVGAPGDDEAGTNAGAVYMYRYEENYSRYVFHSKVLSPAPNGGGGFLGLSVSGQGALLAVGEPGVDGVTEESGAVHVFAFDGADWTWRQTLDATSDAEDQNFGWSLAFEAGAIAVGAPYWNDGAAGSGSVSVFYYDPAAGGYVRKHFLHPTDTDEFGRALALRDGKLVVGAPGSVEDGVERGAVVAYDVTFLAAQFVGRYAGEETEERLGESVAIGRNPAAAVRFAAGAPRHPDGGVDRGTVRVYLASLSQGWIPETRLSSSTPVDSAWLGTDVCFDGFELLGSALLDDVNGRRAGSVRRFDISTGTWSERTPLAGRAVDPGDRYGCDVAVRGDIAVVGAYYDGDIVHAGGSAYVFERGPEGWAHAASLNAGTATVRFGKFGEHVTTDGERILVAAPAEDVARGAAYVFERNFDGNWVLDGRLVSSNRDANDFFGDAIAIDGDYAVVGAFQADGASPGSGAAYVFHRDASGIWYESQILTVPGTEPANDVGLSVALDTEAGELLVASPGGNDGGRVDRFLLDGAVWEHHGPIAPGEGFSNFLFGRGLSLDGDHLAIAAYESLDRGVVHLYQRAADGWAFRDGISTEGRYLGWQIGYDGERLVTGHNRGVKAFQRLGTLWQEDDIDPAYNMFGYPIPAAFADSTVVVGEEDEARAWIGELDPAGPFLAYGFADGSGSPCPCGNESEPDSGEGCVNTTGRGALLRAEGSASVAADDLLVVAEGLPPGRSTRLFVGTRRLLGVPFGDGQRLVGTPFRRLLVRQSQPDGTATWSIPHSIGFWVPGDVRYFQAFYRDADGGVCGNGFNTSSGLAVLMAP